MADKSNDNKPFLLWVWYNVQDGENPQNGYKLLEFETPEEMLLAVARLDKNDEYYTTKSILLHVQAI